MFRTGWVPVFLLLGVIGAVFLSGCTGKEEKTSSVTLAVEGFD